MKLDKFLNAKHIYIIGNGGSASTANHFANDLLKMSGVRAYSLCANEAIVMAYGNDNGYDSIFIDQLKVYWEQGDLLVTISGSGTSKNIVKAKKYIESIGGQVYSFPTMFELNCDMQQVENLHLKLAHDISQSI